MTANIMTKSLNKTKLSIKTQTIAAFIAVVAAVALPQVFHLMGIISGTGTALGAALLPMHLPVIIVGLLAGPYAGAAAGLVSPAISFALTGMPAAVMLPFMMIEVCAYGLFAGLLRNVKMPVILKVLAVQAGGRAIRAIAIIISIYLLGNDMMNVSIIWSSITEGIFGLALQWTLIPLIINQISMVNKYEG